MSKKICIIGYGGHSFVVCDIFEKCGTPVHSYFDKEEKLFNPYNLKYFGNDKSIRNIAIKDFDFFPSIGSNYIRKKSYEMILNSGGMFINAIHPSAVISKYSLFGLGTMIAAGVVINPFVKIGNGVICNTSCSIDHEVIIGDFSHICPGVVLCGNVIVGESSFLGAGTIVKQGVRIGRNTIVGAGSLVIHDIAEGMTVYGVPAKPV